MKCFNLVIFKFILFFYSAPGWSQYIDQAMNSDLIIISSGGKLITNLKNKKSYNEYKPNLVYKVKVSCVINPEKPYIVDKYGTVTFEKKSKLDSINIEYRNSEGFNSEIYIQYAKNSFIQDEGRVLLLKKNKKKHDYFLIDSFSAGKNTLIYQLDLIKNYLEISKLKNDKQKFQKEIDFFVNAYSLSSSNNLFLKNLYPESNLVNYYLEKKVLTSTNLSTALNSTQKQIIFNGLTNENNVDVIFNFDNLNSGFNLTLPDFRIQRNDFYFEIFNSKYVSSSLSDNISEILILMKFLVNENPDLQEILQSKMIDLKNIENAILENEKIEEAKILIQEFMKIISRK